MREFKLGVGSDILENLALYIKTNSNKFLPTQIALKILAAKYLLQIIVIQENTNE